MLSRNAALTAAVVALLSGAAHAEPVTTTSTVNLRSAPDKNGTVVVMIPAGVVVQASRCGEWCEVEWQGRKGFAAAGSLGRVAAAAQNGPVPMGLPKVDDSSPRSQGGAYIWGAGPSWGAGGMGYRGRW